MDDLIWLIEQVLDSAQHVGYYAVRIPDYIQAQNENVELFQNLYNSFPIRVEHVIREAYCAANANLWFIVRCNLGGQLVAAVEGRLTLEKGHLETGVLELGNRQTNALQEKAEKLPLNFHSCQFWMLWISDSLGEA